MFDFRRDERDITGLEIGLPSAASSLDNVSSKAALEDIAEENEWLIKYKISLKYNSFIT